VGNDGGFLNITAETKTGYGTEDIVIKALVRVAMAACKKEMALL
jgi:hypothetical protein